MIVVRTSYPWTASAVLFLQKIDLPSGAVKIQVDKVNKDTNGVIIREYSPNGDCKSISYYRYCNLFSYLQAVKQIFAVAFSIFLVWRGKFVVSDGFDDDVFDVGEL